MTGRQDSQVSAQGWRKAALQHFGLCNGFVGVCVEAPTFLPHAPGSTE